MGTHLKLGTMAASVFLFSIMSWREAETKSPREPAERRAATVILYASRFFNIIVPKPSSSTIFHWYLYFVLTSIKIITVQHFSLEFDPWISSSIFLSKSQKDSQNVKSPFKKKPHTQKILSLVTLAIYGMIKLYSCSHTIEKMLPNVNASIIHYVYWSFVLFNLTAHKGWSSLVNLIKNWYQMYRTTHISFIKEIGKKGPRGTHNEITYCFSHLVLV